LIGVHLRLAENAPAALVAAVAVTGIETETGTGIARGIATATVIVTVTGMIAIVGIEIEIAEIGTATATFERRRRRTIVAAGVPTASAACRPAPSRKMTFLGLRLQSEKVSMMVLAPACLLSVWIRAKNCFIACLVAVSVLLLYFGSQTVS
jgi:hypothetical protein